jgi:type II secretory pathway component GspD/PulD (secretin)
MKKTVSLMLCAALLSAVVFGLCSCGAKVEYEDYGKYTPGDWAQSLLITSIDVEWLSGKVEIVSHVYGYLAVSESSEGMLSDEVKMHWYYDGTTLKIKPAANGVSQDRVPEKTLTVFVPFGYSFSDIDIETVSADVSVSDSGANFIDVETVSGKVSLNLDGKSQQIEAATVSGDIELVGSAARELELTSTSGNITAEGRSAADQTEISTVSGNITLTLPANSNLKTKLESVSGATENAFANNAVGEGAKSVELSSTSGNITLKSK